MVQGEGPNGTFVLDENEKGSHVLLAGGIGITPFRSMIKYTIDKKLGFPLHLIYANPLPEQISYKKELEDWSKESENLLVDLTVTRPKESEVKWSGLVGRIDGKMITKLVKNLSDKTYWLCGPPEMVSATENILGELDITSDKIRSEKFTGY